MYIFKFPLFEGIVKIEGWNIFISLSYDYLIFRHMICGLSCIETLDPGPANVGGRPKETTVIWCDVSG